jgi:hypothetical protein
MANMSLAARFGGRNAGPLRIEVRQDGNGRLLVFSAVKLKLQHSMIAARLEWL